MWQKPELVSELKSALQDISAGNGFFISVLQKLNLFQLKSSNPGTIDVKVNGSVLQEKSSFKRLRLHFFSKLDWGSCIAKTNPRKLEPWFVLWSIFLLRLLFVSINQPYCLVWNFVIARLVLLVAIWIYYRVRINFSMLYRGRLYDKNLLALASFESPSVWAWWTDNFVILHVADCWKT